jgi:hypothetical protein
MGTTAHHGFPVPAPTDEARMVRVHMTALADDIDAKVPKITHGTASDPMPVGPREGDIHLTYLPSAVAAAAPAPAPPPADAEVAGATEVPAAPKKARTRKATG